MLVRVCMCVSVCVYVHMYVCMSVCVCVNKRAKGKVIEWSVIKKFEDSKISSSERKFATNEQRNEQRK